jgi:hypothetical protein
MVLLGLADGTVGVEPGSPSLSGAARRQKIRLSQNSKRTAGVGTLLGGALCR